MTTNGWFFEPEGWVYEQGDPSVGIFGDAWYHDDCGPVIADPARESHEVEQFEVTVVRVSDHTVRTLYRLVCADCAAEVEVTDDDYCPSAEYEAREAAAQAEYDEIDWTSDHFHVGLDIPAEV